MTDSERESQPWWFWIAGPIIPLAALYFRFVIYKNADWGLSAQVFGACMLFICSTSVILLAVALLGTMINERP